MKAESEANFGLKNQLAAVSEISRIKASLHEADREWLKLTSIVVRCSMPRRRR
jgi:hypothetical protein